MGEHVGRVIPRNPCRFGRTTRLDIRISKAVGTTAGQRAEIQVDLFNVLNAIDKDWGDYQGVFGANRNLLAPERCAVRGTQDRRDVLPDVELPELHHLPVLERGTERVRQVVHEPAIERAGRQG